MQKGWRWLWLFPFGTLLLQLGLSFYQRGADDAFITYRYARHLAEGHGMVWNVGDPPVYGTSTPFYMLVLALLYRLGMEPSLGSMIIGWLCWSLLPLVVYQLARLLDLTPPTAAWATLATGLSGVFVLWSPGMETPLYTLLIFLTFERYLSGSFAAAGILAGLVSITRLDGLLIPLVLGIAVSRQPSAVSKNHNAQYLSTSTSQHLIIFSIGVLLVLGLIAWFLWNEVGTLIPNSFQAKRAHEFAISGRYSWRQVAKLGLYWYPLIGLMALWAVPKAFMERNWRVLIGWGLAYQIIYFIAQLPNFYWYALPPVPVLILVAAFGLEGKRGKAYGHGGVRAYGGGLLSRIRHQASRITHHTSPFTFHAFAILSLLWLGVQDSLQIYRDPLGRSFLGALQRKAGLWLAANTPPEATVMAPEIGMIGYYSERRVIDMLGLTQPEVIPALLRRDYLWSVRHFKPDYVFITDKVDNPPSGPLYASPLFQRNYEEVYKEFMPFPGDRHYILFRKVKDDF